jgi:phosphatidylglycerophosphate synthase
MAPKAESPLPATLLWLGAIAGIQFRLLCNLMDGLLAVEGGLKSPTGDMWNDVPDRLADVLILVGAGLGAARSLPWTVHLGWAAAVTGVATAYVRLLGSALTGTHDFCGPMAKQQRMAVLTGGCVLCLIFQNSGHTPLIIAGVLAIILAGGIVTCVRRLHRISLALRARKSNP